MKFSVITSSYNQLELLKKAKQAWDNQTFKDFEWIIADDGSSDGTVEWCQENNIQFVTQPDDGYRLTEILNKAGVLANGEYIVWVMGDSYPKEDFLEQLDKVVAEDRMVNGIRINIDGNGNAISRDWRLDRVFMDEDLDEFQLINPRPWQLMTLNTMCMPKGAYESMGGIYPGYKGYGRMDWDMAAWANYHGMKLVWAMKAIVYHANDEYKPDTPENVELFAKRLQELQTDSVNYSKRTDEKMKTIMDETREERRKVEREKEAQNRILTQNALDKDEI